MRNLTSSLFTLRPLWTTQRSYFARRVLTPRIISNLENQADNQFKNKEISIDKLPKLNLDKTYDEGFLLPDNIKELQSSVKSKANTSSKIPRYEKANDHNNAFRTMMINLSIKKRREDMNLIVLEGKRLINDAIESGVKIKFIYFTLEDHLKDIKLLDMIMERDGTRLMKVLYRDMKIFSSLATSPGIMAVSEKPDHHKSLLLNDKANELPLVLICDSIRDPGNLGATLRTAVAVGISKVILTHGCVDLWNNKVLKSGAGAHFRIPIYPNVNWPDLQDHLPQKFDLYAADSKHTKSVADNLLIEPTNYFDVNFFDQTKTENKILIIGNEAFGLSNNSYELVQNNSGTRIQIPLYHNIESLNSSIAASIVLYEIRRQFAFKKH